MKAFIFSSILAFLPVFLLPILLIWTRKTDPTLRSRPFMVTIVATITAVWIPALPKMGIGIWLDSAFPVVFNTGLLIGCLFYLGGMLEDKLLTVEGLTKEVTELRTVVASFREMTPIDRETVINNAVEAARSGFIYYTATDEDDVRELVSQTYFESGSVFITADPDHPEEAFIYDRSLGIANLTRSEYLRLRNAKKTADSLSDGEVSQQQPASND